MRENIEYPDRKTGETKTFSSVTLPKGTVIDGVDVSYYQFMPLFVNPSRFKGENFRDIPLLADKEVWLKKDALDADGDPVLDEDGKQVKDVVKVMPAQLKDAHQLAQDRPGPQGSHGAACRPRAGVRPHGCDGVSHGGGRGL